MDEEKEVFFYPTFRERRSGYGLGFPDGFHGSDVRQILMRPQNLEELSLS